MDGERRNSQDGPLNLYKLGNIVSLGILDYNPPSNAQIAIKPGVPQTPSIALHAELQKPITRLLRHRLDTQTARVGVCSDHSNRISRLPFLANAECDDGRAISCEVVLSAWLEGGGPAIFLLDLFEPSFGEALDCGCDGVVSCAIVS